MKRAPSLRVMKFDENLIFASGNESERMTNGFLSRFIASCNSFANFKGIIELKSET